MLASSSLGAVAAPALACACGALPNPEGDRASTSVLKETAVLSLRGSTETIVMGLDLSVRAGSGAPSPGTTDPAPMSIVMPTPTVPEVSLAESSTLEEMANATRPREKIRRTIWPHPGADGVAGGQAPPGSEGGSVTVHEQMRIGDYEVSVLGGDVDGVVTWLGENGYVLAEPVTAAMEPYADEGWTFTAIRWADDAAPTSDSGADSERALQPLRFDFETDELVYPMRLSHAATSTQRVHLFVIDSVPVARTDASAASQEVSRPWIGDPTQHDHAWKDPLLAEIAGYHRSASSEDGPRAVVTEFNVTAEPEAITTDFTFSPDPGQEDVIPTETRVEVITVLGLPLGYALVGGAFAVVAILGIGLAIVLASRASRSRAGA